MSDVRYSVHAGSACAWKHGGGFYMRCGCDS